VYVIFCAFSASGIGAMADDVDKLAR